MYNVVLFGIGKKYQLLKKQINEDFNIIAMVDNNVDIQETMVDGFTIKPAGEISKLEYDLVIVMPGGDFRSQIIEQLNKLGVEKNKIVYAIDELSPFLIDPMFFQDLEENDKKNLFKNNVELVYLEINSKCNRQCWFCPNSFVDRKTENKKMSMTIFEKAVDELSCIEYDGDITFSYFNEPLLDDNLEENIKLIKAKVPNAMLHFATNGDYLDKTRLESIQKAGIDRIIISNYNLSNKDDLWTYQSAVNLINEKAKSLGVELVISTDENDMVAVATGYYKSLNIIFNCQNFNYTAYSRAGLLDLNNSSPRTKVCESPYHTLTISHTGEVVFCGQCHNNATSHKEYVVGDLAEQSIFDIFSSEKFQVMRKKALINKNSGPCTNCSADTNTSLLLPPNGPFRLRPRDKGMGINYLSTVL